jgi:hypothetical protein
MPHKVRIFLMNLGDIHHPIIALDSVPLFRQKITGAEVFIMDVTHLGMGLLSV